MLSGWKDLVADDLLVTIAMITARRTVIFRCPKVSNRLQAMLALRPLVGEVAV
jgi:hypothetical protein